MSIDEKEVYITPDGMGRAAIVRRADGVLNIYTHWIWSYRILETLNVVRNSPKNWWEDKTPLEDLYDAAEPERGLYGLLDDARNEVKSLPGFSEATLQPTTKI